jgi:hypothetical protein
MGMLMYDSRTSEIFEDRTLTHLQIVVGAKLVRGESFSFSWKGDPALGDSRNGLWLAPRIPLHFKYFGSRAPNINRAWIDELTRLSNTVGGLHLVAEPTPLPGQARDET